MAELDLSYLVMTAADCDDYNKRHPHNIVSLNQLLEVRAKEQADVVCVGFISRVDGRFTCETSTFAQLFEKVKRTAWSLHTQLNIHPRSLEQSQPSIALLAPSCEEFLLNAFALFRLGWSVLLVAPQNTPSDISKLCATSNVTRLLYHPSMSKSAEEAQSASAGSLIADAISILDHGKAQGEASTASDIRSQLSPEQESDTECIIFHSSGSSGTPKPIPQKHRIWTKAACCKPHTPSFTTTPLFHGGISDLLRAMMSQSALYMYPSTLPVTASNLLQSFEVCGEDVTAFLSVPYILEMLAEVPEGLQKLVSFELVSTGGSPLPSQVGNRMVQHGVKLVSRYGSSESGFLMTSFRAFDEDKEWSYLRPSLGITWLQFEDQETGSFELVVPKHWPTRNKSNRKDGSYATSDLFTKHPGIADAWLLTGRSDDVILMNNGEKASPAPLESVIKRHSIVKDAVVFGSDRPSLGVAIVPVDDNIQPQDISAILTQANEIAPAHAQLIPELVLLLPSTACMPKASKGTLQRGRAYEMLAKEIGDLYAAYLGGTTSHAKKRSLVGGDLLVYILDLLSVTLKRGETKEEDDLFNMGLTSLQSARIRNVLQRELNLPQGAYLPANIVYECSNARQLASYIESVESGQHVDRSSVDTDLALMRQLLNASSFPKASLHRSLRREISRSYVITGATGTLGAHLVAQILHRNENDHVICFVRSKDNSEALSRVKDSLTKHHLKISAAEISRIKVYAVNFADPSLGLSRCEMSDIMGTVNIAIHAAWPVHFGAGLPSFRPQIEGLKRLIKLVNDESARFFFCSSTASVLGGEHHGKVPEKVSQDPRDGVPIGYGRSKWVAEGVCQSAWEAGMAGNIGIIRLGQLSGDTSQGIWKASEGWPQLYATADCVKCLPDLQETLNWLPVDCAASAICDIANSPQALVDAPSIPVFHVVSTSHEVTYKDSLAFAQNAGLQFDIVTASEWLKRLESLNQAGGESDCLQMLPIWQKNYGTKSQLPAAEPSFATEAAERYSGQLASPLTKDLMRKFLMYWQSQGMLHLTG